MAILSYLSAILASITLVQACPLLDTERHDSNRNISARWHSVEKPISDSIALYDSWPVPISWPQRVINNEDEPDFYIPYCFFDTDAYAWYDSIITQAADRWHSALKGKSGLRFVPGSSNTVNNICDPAQVQDNAPIGKEVVVIYRSNDNKGSTSWVGYHPGRTTRVKLDPYTSTPGTVTETDLHMVVHELGHVLGLYHEHQRSDAPDHVWFFCERLEDYALVVERIRTQEAPYWRAGDTIDHVCSNRQAAYRYKFSASQFIPSPKVASGLGIPLMSDKFDEDSIMHYGSWTYAQNWDERKFPENAVLVGHKPGVDRSNWRKKGYAIPGGQVKRDKEGVIVSFKISKLDVERTAQLYPCTGKNSKCHPQ